LAHSTTSPTSASSSTRCPQAAECALNPHPVRNSLKSAGSSSSRCASNPIVWFGTAKNRKVLDVTPGCGVARFAPIASRRNQQSAIQLEHDSRHRSAPRYLGHRAISSDPITREDPASKHRLIRRVSGDPLTAHVYTQPTHLELFMTEVLLFHHV
jgi:hypothetical protein